MEEIANKWFKYFLDGKMDVKGAIQGALKEANKQAPKFRIGQTVYYVQFTDETIFIRKMKIDSIRILGDRITYSSLRHNDAEESELYPTYQECKAKVSEFFGRFTLKS